MKVLLRKSPHAPALQQRRQFLALLRRTQQLLAGENNCERGVIQVVLLGRQEMATLNGLHLQHQGATDVITYDFRNGPAPEMSIDQDCVMAEIYLCPEVAVEASGKYQQSRSRELILYAVHGFLHLYGEDDLTPEECVSMRAAEERLLATLAQDYDLDVVAAF
ncbi:MAG: rRNA maturation RNase YbeY [Oligosphaeraceae bacterium]|nr:rRNA maturation RNase YbeY [Oligosphaeraceae bacterium]